GAADRHRLTLEQQFTAVDLEVAGHRLDHRRLARTVVADQCDDLTRFDVEVRVDQGPDVAEAAGKSTRLENGSHCCHHRLNSSTWLSDLLLPTALGEPPSARSWSAPRRCRIAHRTRAR